MNDTTRPDPDKWKCGSCIYWRNLGLDISRGECRYGPPSATLLPDGQGGVVTNSGFPIMRSNAGCGRFDPKTKVGEA